MYLLKVLEGVVLGLAGLHGADRERLREVAVHARVHKGAVADVDLQEEVGAGNNLRRVRVQLVAAKLGAGLLLCMVADVTGIEQ
jgi:hypothetical protein